MTLLELYEKICTGEIKMKGIVIHHTIRWGLCGALEDHFEESVYIDFCDLFDLSLRFLDKRGVMTHERETFLLLFAAYKGEL